MARSNFHLLLLFVFSYLPFEFVAKVVLSLAALLFISDPYPQSRLTSLIIVIAVALLSKLERKVRLQEKEIVKSSSNDDALNEREGVDTITGKKTD